MRFGAILTSKEAMISALEKLHKEPSLSSFERANARLMFRGFTSVSLFSPHPTLAERKRRSKTRLTSGDWARPERSHAAAGSATAPSPVE